MKAIIIAAGQGTRLRPHTANKPKCMVEVAGRPILHHQIAALRASGIKDIVVVGGYKRQAIQGPGIRVVANAEFMTNNILMSLFAAGTEFHGDCIVSYGDIVYSPRIVSALCDSFFPSALVVDAAGRELRRAHRHPVEQAELAEVATNGLVVRVGKNIGPENAWGEFIGLAKFDSAAIARFWAMYLDQLAQGDDAPFIHAPTLRKAYLTDLLNHAISEGEHLGIVPIEGGWREIDTLQENERIQTSSRW